MRYSITALAIALAAHATAASAQEDSAATDEEIIVTAGKIGTNLDRAPVAAVSLSGETLERLNIQSVRDTQIRMPSVVYDTSGGSAQVYIRGIGTNSAYAGLESSIGTYQDGVYLQRQVGAALDVVDMAGVEVLNGPQGSLYGRNATGGVILVTTKDPTDRYEGSASVEYARFDSVTAEGVVNVPLSQDFAVRVAGKYAYSDGYVTNVANGDRLGGYRNATVRGKLGYNPAGPFSAVLAVEYSRQVSDPIARRRLTGAPECLACAVYGENLPAPGGFYEVDQTRSRDTLISYTAGTLNLRYEGEGFSVVSVTGYRDFSYKVFVDQDFAAGDLFRTRAEEYGWTFTHDSFVRTDFDGPFNFLLGVSGEIDRDTLLGQFFGDAFGSFQGGINHSRVDLRSISPYGEFYYAITPKLKLTLGGRYNIDEKKLRVTNDPTAVLAPGATAQFRQKDVFKDFTPRAVLSYELPDGTVYASFSRGAKSGGYNTPALNPLVPLQSEKLTSYEVGAKTALFDRRLKLAAAGFYYDYKDIQVSFVDAASGGVRAENAANARVYGLELTASAEPVTGLTISGGATWLDAKFKSYTSAAIFCPKAYASPGYPGCPTPTGGPGMVNGVADLSGSRLPRAPEWSFSAAVDYTIPLSDDYDAILTVADRYTGSYDFLAGAGGPLGLSRQDSFHMVTASASRVQRPGGLKLRAFVENLAKAKYYLDLPTSAFGIAGSVGAPRTYGASIGFSF